MEYSNVVTAQVVRYIGETYDVVPELLWKDSYSAAIRHKADKKWFGIIMPAIAWKRMGVEREGVVDVMNVKCDPVVLPSLIDGHGILPGYHMNKQHWLTIVLDGSVPMEKIIWLIDASYMLTLKRRPGKKKE